MTFSTVISYLLTVLLIENIQCDFKVPDYIYWKKADINEWHQFFPSRVLEEERLTNDIAKGFLPSDISEDLKKIVTFQKNELETAQGMMTGTDAEGCINGISNFMEQAVKEQQEEYEDCIADASSKLTRLGTSHTKMSASYQASYERALAGIDTCAKTYPNKDSISRLRSCVESMNKNYFDFAQMIKKALVPSPTMGIFQNTVVACASTAAKNVASKGSQFLKMLVNCAALSGTVDPIQYGEELKRWKGYQDTLDAQLSGAQNGNANQVLKVENDMRKFYSLKKQAMDTYMIETRPKSFYLNKIYSYLSNYYNAVTATALDNPGDKQCAADAKTKLDDIADKGATQSLTCDEAIVKKTKDLMSKVYDNFASTNKLMTSSGNVALLNCYGEGLVFAPNTVKNCFDLASSSFNIGYTDVYNDGTGDVETIKSYLKTSFGADDHPCGGSSLQKVQLDADKVLYKLQRCLYASSGNNYQVTPAKPSSPTKVTGTCKTC